MQQETVINLINKLVKTYPNAYSGYGRSDKEELIDTWAMALEDYDDTSVMTAFKNYLLTDTKGFPPSIGQLVELIPQKASMADKVLTAGEAWTLVVNAMRNVTYNPTDSFDRLPELVQQMLGGVDGLRDLANLSDKGREIERQRFMQEYRDAVKEAKRTGKDLSGMRYKDEVVGGEGPARPKEIRRELEPFPGSIEVANPNTGVLFYVQYEGYPYGPDGWAERGGFTDEKLREQYERRAKK